MSDSVSIGKTVTQSLSETILLDDSVSKAVDKKLLESVSLTDSSSTIKSRIISLSETISLADSAVKEIVTNLSESIALTEGITKKVIVDLSESVQLIDFRPSSPIDIVAVDAQIITVNQGDGSEANVYTVETVVIGGKTYAIVTGQMAGASSLYTMQMIDVSYPTNIVEKDSVLVNSPVERHFLGLDTFTIG